MENTDTVGSLLKRERESRGLSLQEVTDATKITIHNLSALEEDRFDYFPNRVYTRAFLRDYANYLGLDSGALLERYEGLSGNKADPVAVSSPTRRRSPWRIVAGVVAALIVLGALAAAGYIYMTGRGAGLLSHRATRPAPVRSDRSDIATLPKAPVVSKPEAPKPGTPAKPVQPVVPVKPDTMTLQATVLEPVWLRITADGEKVYEGIMPQGAVKTWEAKKTITLRAGKLGAVKVKWNGVDQPPLGTLRESGEKDFNMPEAPGASAVPVTAPAPAPASPTGPAHAPATTSTHPAIHT